MTARREETAGAEPSFLSATRASYDSVAGAYADRFSAELSAKPLDRALLAAFAEFATDGPVADVGCGPGHVTAHLRELGLDAFGVDLSPEMVALARRARPDLRFEVGSMMALDLPDGALGGIVAMYSIIHVPTERLPVVFAEFHRVLAPGGHVLLAFFDGVDETLHREELLGLDVSLDYHLRSPERVGDMLGEAGLTTTARMVREPHEEEVLRRAYLLARKPG